MAARVSRASIMSEKADRRVGTYDRISNSTMMSISGSVVLRNSEEGAGRRNKSEIVPSFGLLSSMSSNKAYVLLALRIDTLVNGKPFAVLMALGLMTALFLPDMCSLLGLSANLGQDIILSMVMTLFVFEFVALTLIDGTYIFTFYWLMDIVGTTSMFFDISFLGGINHSMPHTADNTQSSKHLMLIRAARAARVGARAGRLARVLRMLRFLPCLEEPEPVGARQSVAAVITSALASSVVSRVAALNILLVIVIPLYSVMSSAQYDYSLHAWILRLSLSAKRNGTDGVHQELHEMELFYRNQNFGPYMVCTGRALSGGSFVCKEQLNDWSPSFFEPTFLSSALLVHNDGFMIGFNLERPEQTESVLAILNCLFILVTMIHSGLTLSGTVTTLAVQPLERMHSTIRQIASTVFKFAQDDAGDDDDEADEAIDRDVECASEMELLDKIVQKLAAIAEIHKKGKKIDRTEDMRDEDIGILSMMQGKNVTLMAQGASVPKAPIALQRSKKDETIPKKFLEEIGVDNETFQSMEFNIIVLSKAHKLSLAFFTISTFHAPGDGFVRTQDEKSTLKRFISAAEKEYPPNPFHNLSHAIDCCHMVAKILRQIGSDDFLMELEQFALLIAAVSHDLGHPGVNNAFLSEIGHELAMKYNDRSPLENMHCAKLYTIVAEEDSNVFGKLTREQYKEVRKKCIEAILHTDMLSHQAIVNDLVKTFQVNQDVFAAGVFDVDSPQTRAAEIELFNNAETKVLIMNNLLHSADVSNPCRTWETAQAWGYKVIEEFFSQGDEERRLGIPVQFLNDRTKLNKPNSQIGFIEFMMAPYYFAQIKLWPSLTEFGEELVTNLTKWEEMWVSEVNPSEEERQKVRARVAKVLANFADARRRTAS